ncbi:MAG TPA: hypothetical protein VK071_11960 [Tissierellales bacterium]|nr:hypothetical protein [Tissierellales bacterium]
MLILILLIISILTTMIGLRMIDINYSVGKSLKKPFIIAIAGCALAFIAATLSSFGIIG